MAILLYNTLTRRKEEFKSLDDKRVTIYTCGPTVYDYAHIGNLRSYVFADTLARTLKLFGYRVKWVMNITDIDDKTIAGAARAKTTLRAFTQKFTDLFFLDLKLLNVKPASVYPRATAHFKEMQAIIAKLKKRGLAYEAEDGIYFAVTKFPGYGKLSQLDKRTLRPGARVAVDEYNKQSPGDFALWKFQRTEDGEQRTDGPSSVFRLPFSGRPGWHLECSAMSRKYLGQPFDIHTGGVDLIFPHHENEIAQSQGAFGVPLARYFVHNEHLLVEGKRMAKSEGNFVTMQDVVKRGFEPSALRYLFLTSHYRDKLNFTWDSLTAAEETLRGIRQTVQRSLNLKLDTLNAKIAQAVEHALADDLNTPQALALLHQANDAKLWLHFDKVFGLNLKLLNFKLSVAQRALVKQRDKLRTQGEYQKADAIRRDLAKQGIILEDSAEGTRVVSNNIKFPSSNIKSLPCRQAGNPKFKYQI